MRDDRVARLFADGHTVVLQGVHRTWAPVTALATGLERRPRPPGAGQRLRHARPRRPGFSAHYDVHDVFVLQIAGTKRWHVHAPVHADPLRTPALERPRRRRRAPARSEEPLLDEVLHPGDALYLPRGYLHSATAQGEVVRAPDRRGPRRHPPRPARDAARGPGRRPGAARPPCRSASTCPTRPRSPRTSRSSPARAAEYFADRSHDDDRAERAARRLRGRVWTGQPARAAAPAAPGRGRARPRTRTPCVRAAPRPAPPHRAPDADGAGCASSCPTARWSSRPRPRRRSRAPARRARGPRSGTSPEAEPGDAVVVARRLLTEGVLVTPDSAAAHRGPRWRAGRPRGYDGDVTAADSLTQARRGVVPVPLLGGRPRPRGPARSPPPRPRAAGCSSSTPARGARRRSAAPGSPDDVVDAIDAFCRAHEARFQLIRRPAARGAPDRGGRPLRARRLPRRATSRCAGAASTPPEALPAALADLEASTELSDEPVYLVCAHGRHDACCAMRGRPVAAELAADAPATAPGRRPTPAATGSPPTSSCCPTG